MEEYDVTIFDGRTEWRNQDGKLHRLDGPAMEWEDGSRSWFVNGQIHRLDGPAVEQSNGYKSWWIEDCRYSEEEFNEKIKQEAEKKNRSDDVDVSEYNGIRYKVKVYGDRTEWRNRDGKLHRLNGPALEYRKGSKFWYIDGKLHRLDGPASEYANGDREWWFKGELHRLDGPAIEYRDGSKEWWKDGKRHRLDGPAVERENGYRGWYIEGKQYYKRQFDKKIGKPTILDIIISKLKDIFN